MSNETCVNTPNSIVSWSNFTCDPVCGPIRYDVTISPYDGVNIAEILYTSYNFSGLQPDTNYTVTIVGINMVGMGDFLTKKISVATSCSLPVAEATSSGKL